MYDLSYDLILRSYSDLRIITIVNMILKLAIYAYLKILLSLNFGQLDVHI